MTEIEEEFIMLDLQTQKQVMLSRLAYYRRVMNDRSEGYRQLKITFSIPRIKRALQKIEDGSYGICEDCGDQIPEKRLESIPAALLCICCQRSFEKK